MVAVAATLFAVNGTVSKVILGSGIDAAQLTEVRCAGALLGLTLIALATRPSSLRLRRAELPLIVSLGVGGLTLVQWSYFFAIHRVAIGIALVIQFVGPILVALWARFVYGEQVRARIWVALALALTGLLLIVEVWQSHRPNAAGSAAAALAAVTYAAYSCSPSRASVGATRSRSRRGASSSRRCSGRCSPRGGTSPANASRTASRCSATSPPATCPSGR
jgi:drug/metabolite transporter (DMT)-like permease